MTTRPILSAAGLLAIALVLPACTSQDDAATDQSAEASGEVLEGSIGDAMLPLEEVTSAAPVAQTSPAAAEGGTASPAPETGSDAEAEAD